MTVSPIPSIPSTPLPGERVPLPEGLTRLADGALRADGVDGVAVINPASGSDSCAVSVETGLRVLQALGGTYLPTVGPAAPSAPSAESPQAVGTSQVAPLRRADLRPVASGSTGIVPAGPRAAPTRRKPGPPGTPAPPAAAGDFCFPQPAAPPTLGFRPRRSFFSRPVVFRVEIGPVPARDRSVDAFGAYSRER